MATQTHSQKQLAFSFQRNTRHTRRRKLLCHNDALLGYHYILAHVQMRCVEGRWSQSFYELKDYVLQYLPDKGITHYTELPEDTKSFIGRCGNRKKAAPHTSYCAIAKIELEKIQQESNELYRCAIIEPARDAANKIYVRTLRHKYETHRDELLDEWYSYAEQHPHNAYPESV